jgi:putative flippase GtrA
MSGRFIRFLLTGGFAALINLGSRYVLVSYLTHKHYTFRAAGISTQAEFAVAPDINARPRQRP